MKSAVRCMMMLGAILIISGCERSSQRTCTTIDATMCVTCTTVYRNELIAGGHFESAGGSTVNNIARWDGEAWHAMGSALDGVIYTLEVYDNQLIAGGQYEYVGQGRALGIACWDGETWNSMGTGLELEEEYVYDMTVMDGKLYVGGCFKSMDGQVVNNIACWNGSAWEALGHGAYRCVHAVTAYDGKLVMSDRPYETVSQADTLGRDGISIWDGTAWEIIGVVSDTTNEYASVWNMVSRNGDLIVNGGFDNMDGVGEGTIFRWNGSEWNRVELDISPYAYEEYNNTLLAGGVGGFVVWDGVDDTVYGQTQSPIYTMTVYGGEVFVGGKFWRENGAVSDLIAGWDGTEWFELAGGIKPERVVVSPCSPL